MTVVKVTDHTTRAELAATITDLSARRKRATLAATRERMTRLIDALLDEWAQHQ